MIKAPKLYFYDTGLAAFLLGIQQQEHVAAHPLRGALFENLVVSELLKKRFNQGKTDNLYYLRDSKGLKLISCSITARTLIWWRLKPDRR